MAGMKEAMEKRKKAKSRKPDFVRQSIHKKIGIEERWRKPKGLHSKMRLGRKGHSRKVKPGYGSPAQVKGKSREGLDMVLVSNPQQLKGIDTSKQGILISSGTGKRKKLAILEEAVKNKITVLNIKDPSEYIKQAEEEMKKKKESKAAKEETKKKKKEELKKKAEEKEKEKKLEETLSDEEKKEQDKKEQDKMLTKRS
ncbi:MAG: eL32 family ribosomal protein [Candidatus Woesearchaeota archaeon]